MIASSSPQLQAVGEVHKDQKTDSNEARKQSYASTIIAKQSAPSNLDLFPIVVNQGEPVIQFTNDEVNNFIKEEGLHQAVVIKFSYGRPDLSEVRRIFSSQFDVQGNCNIGHLEYRHLLVRFDLYNDYVQFLSKSSAYLKSKRDEYFFRTFPWSLEFNPKEETPMAVVWISLPGLPPNLFAKGLLMSIASAVGKPLAVDKATNDRSRPSAARVKVILNLLDNHPKKIKLQIFDRLTGKTAEFYQQIVFDNLPKYCTYCKHQGHDIKSCRIKKEKYVAENLAEVQVKGDKDGQEVEKLGKLKGDARDFLNAKRNAQSVTETQGNVDKTVTTLIELTLQKEQSAEGIKSTIVDVQKDANANSGLDEPSAMEINPTEVNVEPQETTKQFGSNVPMQSSISDVQNGQIVSDRIANKEVQIVGSTVSLQSLNMPDFEASITNSNHEKGTISGVNKDRPQQNSIRTRDFDEDRLIQSKIESPAAAANKELQIEGSTVSLDLLTHSNHVKEAISGFNKDLLQQKARSLGDFEDRSDCPLKSGMENQNQNCEVANDQITRGQDNLIDADTAANEQNLVSKGQQLGANSAKLNTVKISTEVSEFHYNLHNDTVLKLQVHSEQRMPKSIVAAAEVFSQKAILKQNNNVPLNPAEIEQPKVFAATIEEDVQTSIRNELSQFEILQSVNIAAAAEMDLNPSITPEPIPNQQMQNARAGVELQVLDQETDEVQGENSAKEKKAASPKSKDKKKLLSAENKELSSVSNSFDVLANIDEDERTNKGLTSCHSQTPSQKSEEKKASHAQDSTLQTRSILKSNSDHKVQKRAKSSKPKLWKDQGDYDDDETWGEGLASFSWEEEDQGSGEDSEDSVKQKIERKIANKNSRAKVNQTTTSNRRLNHNAPVYVPANNLKAVRSLEETSMVNNKDHHLISVDDRFATQQPSSSFHTSQKHSIGLNTVDMSQAKQFVTVDSETSPEGKQSLEVIEKAESNIISDVSVLNSQELPKISCTGTHFFEEGEEEDLINQCRADASLKGDLSPMHSTRIKKAHQRERSWDGNMVEVRKPPMRIAKQKQAAQTNFPKSNRLKNK